MQWRELESQSTYTHTVLNIGVFNMNYSNDLSSQEVMVLSVSFGE